MPSKGLREVGCVFVLLTLEKDKAWEVTGIKQQYEMSLKRPSVTRKLTQRAKGAGNDPGER